MRERSGTDWRGRQVAAADAQEAFGARVAGPLRAAEAADPTLAARVMSHVRDDPRAGGDAWWRRGVTVRITPLHALALAAALTCVVVGADRLSRRTDAGTPDVAAARPDTVHVVRFVFVAPAASSVALVGDFNRWDGRAHRLTRSDDGGVWSLTLTLPAGRHEYAFVIDDRQWVADPSAAAVVGDEFGGESSVIVVGRPGAPSST